MINGSIYRRRNGEKDQPKKILVSPKSVSTNLSSLLTFDLTLINGDYRGVVTIVPV